MKQVITEVSIVSEGGNPCYNALKVGPVDEASGSFLRIRGEDNINDGAFINIDWKEWDRIVEVVAKYRDQWEWDIDG